MKNLSKVVAVSLVCMASTTYGMSVNTNQIMADRYSIEETKDYIEINVECTFYTSLSCCNGDDSKLTASGEELSPSTVAVPRKKDSTEPIFPFNTVIEIEGYGERKVQDTGNPKYLKIKDDGTYILDIYITKNKNESDKEYYKRVYNMGRVNTTAKVYL